MHVNTGFSVVEKNVNSALCTAGALTQQTSARVNSDLQRHCPVNQRWGPFESDQAFIYYVSTLIPAMRLNVNSYELQDIADQMIGLGHYISQKNTSHCLFKGDPRGQTRGRDVIPFMQKQKDGTHFAVFTSDGASLFGEDAHWICAEKRAGRLEFQDFQMDRLIVPHSSYASSNKPLGPGGTSYSDADATYMMCIAFGDQLIN